MSFHHKAVCLVLSTVQCSVHKLFPMRYIRLVLLAWSFCVHFSKVNKLPYDGSTLALAQVVVKLFRCRPTGVYLYYVGTTKGYSSIVCSKWPRSASNSLKAHSVVVVVAISSFKKHGE